jgi:nucleoside-diphosphate-sugar epimerase
MDRGTIAITGATGLLGGALCRRFVTEGWRVRAVSRAREGVAEGAEWFRGELPGDLDERALRGADVVIHAAYAMRSRGEVADRVTNLAGSRRVFAASRAAGVGRLVFVSSVSAHERAEGFYGRSKRELEEEMDPGRDLVMRPGLILARGAGLFDRMVRVVKGTGIVPLFGGGKQVIQTVHLDDLCEAFVRAVRKDSVGSLTVCEPEGLTMRGLFEEVGRVLGRRVTIVPLPFGPVLLGLRVCEAVGMRLPVSADNLLGLRSMRHWDSRPSLKALDMTVRSAPESLKGLLGDGGGT